MRPARSLRAAGTLARDVRLLMRDGRRLPSRSGGGCATRCSRCPGMSSPRRDAVPVDMALRARLPPEIALSTISTVEKTDSDQCRRRTDRQDRRRGRAARMGHRLTLRMDSGASPSPGRARPGRGRTGRRCRLLQVQHGEGRVTPLSGPEKGVARGNGLKTLDSKRFPTKVPIRTALRAPLAGTGCPGR